MKTISKITIIMALAVLNACDYLDIVPDNVSTIDYAFRSRNEAERYLYTCYSYRPPIGDIFNDPATTGCDETWQFYSNIEIANPVFGGQQIARGFQNADDPYLNVWRGERGSKALWQGIRDCNIFLENIDKVPDLQDHEKKRWIGEANFLKAYYHYYLFKCYGPIPIVDVNLPISASVNEVKVYREPVDKVVEYISNLLLEATQDLPNTNEVVAGSQAGRADKLIALTLRAEVLLFAASPLFNGNADYSGMVDNRGEKLFNTTYDVNKWKMAADACKQAVDLCHAQYKELYDQIDPLAMHAPPQLQLQTTFREAICDRWNKELIWGSTNNDCSRLQGVTHGKLIRMNDPNMINTQWAPTLKIAERFYSSNGVPIDEDRTWQQQGWYENRYRIRPEPSSGDEIYYVKEGQKTAYLHYNREMRFYASVGFDRGIYYGSGYFDFPANVKHCELMIGEFGGFFGAPYPITGYNVKKMHSFKCALSASNITYEYYPFPILRLADLYLMYAEALNEADNTQSARDEAINWIDKVRARAGLAGVKEAWATHSIRPDRPNSQDGLRSIIQHERTIELAFEGKRFWDLRRWKQIEEHNTQPQGWNMMGETPEDFYRIVDVARVPVRFSVKDYFWPIKVADLIGNPNLIQNYGW